MPLHELQENNTLRAEKLDIGDMSGNLVMEEVFQEFQEK